MIECMVRKNVFIFFFKVLTIVSVFKLGNGIYHLLKRNVWSLKKVFGDRFGVLAFQFTQMNANLEISQLAWDFKFWQRVWFRVDIATHYIKTMFGDGFIVVTIKCTQMNTHTHTHTHIYMCVAFLSGWLRVWSKENLQIL
jgi:hypothetical protein